MSTETFWSKTAKTDAGCWEWTASRRANGYGQVNIGGRNRTAHRVAYELAHGPIPARMLVDHVCHNRACINPAHLRLATVKQNAENRSPESRRGASGVRGVSWDRSRGLWLAKLTHNYRTINLGRFHDLGEARNAVSAARASLFTHSDADRGAAA